MAKTKSIKIGVIGAGGIAAKLHLPELKKLSGVEITVIGGRKTSRLETICRLFDVPRWTHSYEEILDDPSIDAILIALPHPLHVPWGLKALQAGKHVFMEKPLCISMEEADAFVTAVENSDRIVLALPFTDLPEIIATSNLIAEGKLGRVSSAHARASHGGPEHYYQEIQELLEEEPVKDLWFFDADRAGAGALFDMGVYAIANLVATLGAVRRVSCFQATVDKPATVEDTAAMLLEFENSAIATVETGWCDGARTRTFSIHGSAGKLFYSEDNKHLDYYTPGIRSKSGLCQKSIDLSKLPRVSPHKHWIDCINRNSPPARSNARTARHITEIMLAGLESAKLGEALKIKTRL